MSYGRFTQGSIIDGMRSERYPGIVCKGIAITARCDISQCKVTRIYYLTAMDVKTWVETEGVLYVAETKFIKDLNQIIQEFRDKIPGLLKYQNASTVSLKNILTDISKLPETSDKDKIYRRLKGIEQYAVEECDVNHRLEALSELRKKAYKQLDDIFGDKIAQYHYIPELAYSKSEEKVHYDGLIVNLLDVNYWDSDIVGKIERQEADFDKLSPDEKESYNKMFFLEKPGDMIFPEEEIGSPYIERLMQAFSFAFIRIGVDFDRQTAKNHWASIRESI